MLINVLNHTLDMGIGELQEMRGQLDAGKLRLLAVVGEERMSHFPQVPTVEGAGDRPRGSQGSAASRDRRVRRPTSSPRGSRASAPCSRTRNTRSCTPTTTSRPVSFPTPSTSLFMDDFGRQTADFLKQTGVISDPGGVTKRTLAASSCSAARRWRLPPGIT